MMWLRRLHIPTYALVAGFFALCILFSPSRISADETTPIEHETTVVAETAETTLAPEMAAADVDTYAEKDSHDGEAVSHGGGHGALGVTFLYLAILLISAKAGGILEKLGQPAVLGDIFAGIVLSALAYAGVSVLSDIRHSEIMVFLAELGAVILLFQIGLEANIKEMMGVGVNALLIALIGVVAPFGIGYLASSWLFPDQTLITHLFVGASLVATSVGITAYVFQSMRASKSRACQTVLGAAVIDDVLGLLVLAIASAMATGGAVTPSFVLLLVAKAFGFLAGAVLLGNYLAKPLSDAFSKIHTGTGMKIGIAMTIALVFAYGATLVGLAPIVGAFAAGLILDAVHFESYEAPTISDALEALHIDPDHMARKDIDHLIAHAKHTHVEDMIHSIGLIFVPIFFTFTGLQIEFASLLNPSVYVYALIISILAVIGKLVAGLAAKGNVKEKLLVGMSMVPRGEVGLIFAAAGKSLGAINDTVFSTIVLVIIVTTFLAPPVIKKLLVEVKG